MSDEKCTTGQITRNKLCCWPTICVDQTFIPCRTNNSGDVCIQCEDDRYINGQYNTKEFTEAPKCVDIERCLPEEIKDGSGKCVCNREDGYIKSNTGICVPADRECQEPGQELDWKGNCVPCGPGYFKDKHGRNLCRAKSRITNCPVGHFVNDGNSTSDRTCSALILTTTRSTTVSTEGNNIQKGLSTGDIVGIALGVSSLVVLIVFVVCCVRRKKKSKQNKDYKETDECLIENNNLIGRSESGVDKVHKENESSFSATIQEQSIHYGDRHIFKDEGLKAVPIDEEETFPKGTNNENNRAEGSRERDEVDTPRPSARVEAIIHVVPEPNIISYQPQNDDPGRMAFRDISMSLDDNRNHRGRHLEVANGNAVRNGPELVDSISVPSDSFQRIIHPYTSG